MLLTSNEGNWVTTTCFLVSVYGNLIRWVAHAFTSKFDLYTGLSSSELNSSVTDAKSIVRRSCVYTWFLPVNWWYLPERRERLLGLDPVTVNGEFNMPESLAYFYSFYLESISLRTLIILLPRSVFLSMMSESKVFCSLASKNFSLVLRSNDLLLGPYSLVFFTSDLDLSILIEILIGDGFLST